MPKILLVEDDNNLREIYGARLSAEGYDIVSANDGEEALAIAVKEKPDLVISDVMMPRISGFDMLDILRNAPETKDTKVIMMTALSQAEDKARADKLGADMYLVKSQVTLEDVAKAVRDILNPEAASTDEAGPAPSESLPGPAASPPPTSDVSPPAPGSDPPEAEEPPAASTPTMPTEPVPSPQPSTSSPASAADDSSGKDDTAAKDESSSTPDSKNSPQQAFASVQPVPTGVPSDPPVTPTPQPVPPPEQPEPDPDPENPEVPPAPDEPVSVKPAPSANVVPQPLTTHAADQPSDAVKESGSVESISVSQPAAAVSDNAVPAAQTTPIQVVLPDDEETGSNPSAAEQAANPNDGTKAGNSPQLTDLPPQNIGPNLAEALAEEEVSENEQGKAFEKKSSPPPPPAPPVPVDSAPALGASPVTASQSSPPAETASKLSKNIKIEVKEPETQSTAPELNQTLPSENPPTPPIVGSSSNTNRVSVSASSSENDSPRTNMSDEKPRIESDDDDSSMPKKLVLQPSEDFLNGGSNLAALLDKEMANEAVQRPDPNTVIKDPESKGHQDPEQVIDEIHRNNQEIDKIAL